MTIRKFVASAGLLILCLAPSGTSFSQQTSTPSSIQPNPLVEQILRAAPDGEQIVELKGYVGPSTPETVRLYESLALSRYVEIPRSAIVYSTQEGDPKTGPVKLHVRGSAMIVSARRHAASAAAFTSSRPGGLAGAGPQLAAPPNRFFRAGYCGYAGSACGGGTQYGVWECSDGVDTVYYYVAEGSC